MRLRSIRSIFAASLAASALVPAAARAQNSRAEQLLSERPPPREGCVIETQPRTLPPLSQLADSATLATDVAAYAKEHPITGDKPMFALYSIGFDAHGVVERVTAIEYLLPREKETELADRLRASLRQQRGPLNVRLRIEPGGAAPFRVGRSERCPPRSNMRFSLVVPATAPAGTPPSIVMRTVVGPDGGVLGQQMIRRTGSTELDLWVENSLGRRRYAPGLIDGQPVQMEVEETVRIRARP
ncbi:hypothetical protein [Longimicrobium sp.]|uniref:hypothetical protein n=1 Tax=Longimicrobium sp. TaxID=2029185 RepID=UPI002B886FBC|nr:hypothetical protein [Longimicrobium sp.]HSU18063.1 hypothetical protein [Longimicrobium sp.]